MTDTKGICPYCNKYKTTIIDRSIDFEVVKSCYECYLNHLQQKVTHGESILDRIKRLLRNGDK